MKTIQIDGEAFNNLATFYDEIQRQFCPTFADFGRNLDAVRDVLSGGFEVGERIQLVWLKSQKSAEDLGWTETIAWREASLLKVHPTNVASWTAKIAAAKRQEGFTLFEIFTDMIQVEGHQLILK